MTVTLKARVILSEANEAKALRSNLTLARARILQRKAALLSTTLSNVNAVILSEAKDLLLPSPRKRHHANLSSERKQHTTTPPLVYNFVSFSLRFFASYQPPVSDCKPCI